MMTFKTSMETSWFVSTDVEQAVDNSTNYKLQITNYTEIKNKNFGKVTDEKTKPASSNGKGKQRSANIPSPKK